MHRSSNVFPSTWPVINLSKEVPIWRNFTNFSVTANANEVLRFNFTKFSVKSNANEVVTFNFTIFSVKSNTTSQVLWKSTIKWDHAQKFPWNQLFSNFFSKIVDLTEKMVIFPCFWLLFHTVVKSFTVKLISRKRYKNFVNCV